MPQEIVDKMGIKYKTLPDERLRQKDQELLVILYHLLNVEHKELVKDFLSEEYINYIERKIERLKAIKEGTIVNLSKVGK